MTSDGFQCLDFQGDPAVLYLARSASTDVEDDPNALGSIISGYSFGANTSVSGEVVFNTGMVGYPEALTDPSYRGQILVLTYPLIGNYGVPDEQILDEYGLPKYFESSKIHIAGLIVSSYSWQHSHWAAQKSLSEWLQTNQIPAMYGVDTRELTKLLREHGSILGRLEVNPQRRDVTCPKELFQDPNQRNLVEEVSVKHSVVYGKGRSPKIIAYDCGMKYNIIRYFVDVHGVELTVVPFNYDLEKNPENIEWQGLFLSNGPGNPEMCSSTIKSIQYALVLDPPRPIFGICLGNQLLALAAGAKTYKLKYGNRGMNQPAIDLRTGRCYITPQNHGYAVDAETLPQYWKPLFLNANDLTNEGIVHTNKPFFSVQFHPEASGGPCDTGFLFDKFVGHVKEIPQPLVLQDTFRYERKTYKKVLLVGSGGLSIGQAGEFDYSGSQCIKALKEEGIDVILINPNIATVQTSQEKTENQDRSADHVYFLPINPDVVMDVINKEKPDGIIVSMGGQTALNVGVELWQSGRLQAAGVEVLGTQIPVIVATEDREIFSEKLKEIGETIALSYSATTIDEAIEAANKIGYPVLIRAAYALGGLGSGFAANDDEIKTMAAKAFATSSQILIDQDLRGWKELEYEVVRDNCDNCITVCNMENFDPLGIHTGDSIVVAPSQTLTNREYFMLRRTAIKVVRHLGIVGECNIQYALDPESERYCIIEVNARLSRSSALASKATGYPLAYVATKISLGKDLVSIRNSVTKTTTACFEPSLDYCVVKMPRWDLKKFSRVSNKLGSSMLSVGEVMSIGRTFEETIQKACRMVNPSLDGLEGEDSGLIDDSVDLETRLRTPTDTRLFAVQVAFERGWTVERVHDLTKIDNWFLSKLKNIATMRKAVVAGGSLDVLTGTNGAMRMKVLKMAGFSDRQIARYVGLPPGLDSEARVRHRRKSLGITPVVKQIDTLAAEFPAHTNYLYVTYSGSADDVDSMTVDLRSRHAASDTTPKDSPEFVRRPRALSNVQKTMESDKERGVIVLGCGAYCIGSSVEFDWCAVSCIRQLRHEGYKSIIINYNPETVSTDYDESDRLYFEEISTERVLDIYERENPTGVVVSVGGQIPNNLAEPLAWNGVTILGTSSRDIERAEDRRQFSDMLDALKIPQPAWSVLTMKDQVVDFAQKVGFPVLVRPSFVLSGASMRVAADEAQLRNFLDLATDVGNDKPVVVTKFIVNAKEIEFDAVANKGEILNYAIGEHLEDAGVHSGDATVILPAQKLYVRTIRQVKRYASAIAKSLRITGPFNIQFMAKGNNVQVIECNLRASRTFPFVSKTLHNNFISLATKAMIGVKAEPYKISLLDIDYVCVKAPIFSFTRLRGADPTLGVEMASTGEVACFGEDIHEAFLQSLLSTSFKLPNKNKTILLSIASDEFRQEFAEAAGRLQKCGFTLYGTPGTATYYEKSQNLTITTVSKPDHETDDGPGTALHVIKEGKIDLVINVSEGTTRKDEITAGYLIRRATVDFGVALVTDVKCAITLAECFSQGMIKGRFVPRHIGEYYKIPAVGWTHL